MSSMHSTISEGLTPTVSNVRTLDNWDFEWGSASRYRVDKKDRLFLKGLSIAHAAQWTSVFFLQIAPNGIKIGCIQYL